MTMLLGFVGLKAATAKSRACWDLTGCSLVPYYQHFGGTSRIHFFTLRLEVSVKPHLATRLISITSQKTDVLRLTSVSFKAVVINTYFDSI
jgi:hypothetical protein